MRLGPTVQAKAMVAGFGMARKKGGPYGSPFSMQSDVASCACLPCLSACLFRCAHGRCGCMEFLLGSWDELLKTHIAHPFIDDFHGRDEAHVGDDGRAQ